VNAERLPGLEGFVGESATATRFARLGMIARWRPVHRGHLAVLRALCDAAAEALIGIGSANRYNLRNPFTLEETTDMLRLALAGRGGSEAAGRETRSVSPLAPLGRGGSEAAGRETRSVSPLAPLGRGGSEAAGRETRSVSPLAPHRRENYRLIPVPDLDDGPRWRVMVREMFGPLDAFVTDNPYVASLLREDYRLLRPVELIAETDRVAIDGTMVRAAMARGGEWQRLVPPEVAAYMTARGLDERFRREFGLQTLALETMIAERKD
jgi:nicotinamide mononucleotide adenylyltransferase